MLDFGSLIGIRLVERDRLGRCDFGVYHSLGDGGGHLTTPQKTEFKFVHNWLAAGFDMTAPDPSGASKLP
jgi:hypothetical protein